MSQLFPNGSWVKILKPHARHSQIGKVMYFADGLLGVNIKIDKRLNIFDSIPFEQCESCLPPND